MSCEDGYGANMISLRTGVIKEAIEVQKVSCPSLTVLDYVIDPNELRYPIDNPTHRTVYSVLNIIASIQNGADFVNSITSQVEDGRTLKQKKIKELLNDEDTQYIFKLSILGLQALEVMNSSTEDDTTQIVHGNTLVEITSTCSSSDESMPVDLIHGIEQLSLSSHNEDMYDSNVSADILQANIGLIKEKKLDSFYLADSLVSRGVLSEGDKDIVISCTNDDGMNYLIGLVIASVRSDGAVFGDFLNMIKEEGSDGGKELAEELTTLYTRHLENSPEITNRSGTDRSSSASPNIVEDLLS
jgi:hypothetical protein